MTKQEAIVLINQMKKGEKYFWNKGSSKEGVAFELFFIENGHHYISEGFHYFDYNDEQINAKKENGYQEFEGKLLAKNFGSKNLWSK